MNAACLSAAALVVATGCAAQEFHKVLKLTESLAFVTKSGGISPSILVMQTAEY
jgi:hypothetical protein